MNRSVFISSTYEDLKEYRRKAWEVLRTYAADIRGMEEFGARKEAALETCLAEVDLSDVFVGILGFRLGSVDESSGKSFTQREYERACELGKELLIYLMDERAAVIPAQFVDRDERHHKLEDFKRLLRSRHTVATFGSEEDFAERLQKDLSRILTPQQSAIGTGGDEYQESADTLRKFLLVPKEYSDRQVRVVVNVTGAPFPASREVCDAFQLTFGRTIGVWMTVQQPSGFGDVGLGELFARGDQIAGLLVPSGTLLDVYADLQFADKRIGRVAARFKSESGMYVSAAVFNPLSTTQPGMEHYYHEADSKIALLLTEVISAQSPGAESSSPAGS